MGNPQIYLASSSPRRRELLDQIGLRYEVLSVDVPEVRKSGEPAEDFVVRLALEKARAAWLALQGRPKLPVLGADTVVVLDGEIMGKPSGRDAALAMLARLSGRQHQVYTGVALVARREAVRLNVTQVRFREIGTLERVAYCNTGEPMDKAGAYGIQGRAAVFVAHLAGSFSAVVGLPLFETAELLRDFGIPILEGVEAGVAEKRF